MTTEPYRKVGRGGAGNYFSSAQVQDAGRPMVDDIEAQATASNHVTQINPNRPPPDYATMGRGGAGNWYQPGELLRSPPESSASAGPPFTSGNTKASYRGRGGAGNFEPAEAETESSRKEREAAAERVREQLERDVQLEIRSPEKAYVGEGRIAQHGKRF